MKEDGILENRNKHLSWLVTCALMVALGVVFKTLLAIDLGPMLRLSFALVPAMTAGILFGPLSGFIVGALTDTIGFLIKPTGPWIISTLLAFGLSGVIPSLFVSHFRLKHEAQNGSTILEFSRSMNLESVRTYWRLQVGVLVSQIVCSMGINTLGIALVGGKGFIAVLATRWPAALIMAFVYPLIILAIVRAWKMVFKGLPETSWRLPSRAEKIT